MKLQIAWIGKTRAAAVQSLTQEYLTRISRYAEVEAFPLKDEAGLLRLQNASRKPTLILLDAGGRQLSSEEFARFLQDHQVRALPLLFAVGPADGFSEPVRKAAKVTLSLGKMTLAHELARIVLLEQIYRAFTILQGHPYHRGHGSALP